jgi:hypothetical protein
MMARAQCRRDAPGIGAVHISGVQRQQIPLRDPAGAKKRPEIGAFSFCSSRSASNFLHALDAAGF